MSRRTALLLFLATALLALVSHYFTFEMSYMWYARVEDARLMRGIYAVLVVVVALLWVFYPSRIAVGLLGVLGLYFPYFVFAPSAAPLVGREIGLAGVGVTMISVALLVAATHFRLKSRLAS